MKIGTLFYEFTSKELKEAADQDFADRRKIRKEWGKFLKKYGADTKRWFVVANFNEERLAGAVFKEPPDESQWRRPKNMASGYEPIPTGPSRKIAKEMRALPIWTPKRVQELTKWQDIYHEGFMHFFSFLYTPGKFSGMSAPEFDRPIEEAYKPVPGMRLVTRKTYERKTK